MKFRKKSEIKKKMGNVLTTPKPPAPDVGQPEPELVVDDHEVFNADPQNGIVLNRHLLNF